MFEDDIEKLCTSMEYAIILEVEVLRNLARLRIAWDLYGEEFIINVRQDGDNKYYLYHEFPLYNGVNTDKIKKFIEARGLYTSYNNSMNWIIAKGLDNSEQMLYALIEIIKLCTQVEVLHW